MREKSLYEELNGSYVEVGDVKIPTLISVNASYEIGFWGQRHKEYLKENHRVIYYNLLTSGKLNLYLHKIDIRAKDKYDDLIHQLAESQDVTEKLKEENQMLWVQMNNIRNQAREIIYDKIIYTY
ncbi:TnpV protein [uncultured Clostridium sp.]|uniref:TnpV protein n=1 Tax=uncultured Clostridium sp. TaxID=59620 RepID=UPI00272B7CBC|nr:TnpV protein [uncultured Clostridium sp.]